MTRAQARRDGLPPDVASAFAAIERSLASLMDVCGMEEPK